MIVKEVLEGEISLEDLSKKYTVSVKYIRHWVKMCSNIYFSAGVEQEEHKSGFLDQPAESSNRYHSAIKFERKILSKIHHHSFGYVSVSCL